VKQRLSLRSPLAGDAIAQHPRLRQRAGHACLEDIDQIQTGFMTGP